LGRRSSHLKSRPQRTESTAHPTELTVRGIALAQAGRAEEAAKLFGLAAARMPNDPAAHNNFGNALLALGRRADALACFDRAVSLSAGYAEAHYNRAVVLHDLGRYEEAVASCDRVLALNPDYAAACNNRGAALQGLGRLEEAVASYDRALALKPDHAPAHSNRGVALQKLGRLKRAIESYDRALTIRADYAEAHSNRGSALLKMRRFEEALASIDRALAIDPRRADAHNNRGLVLTELGRIDEALASFDRAIALEPTHAPAHDNRGVALAMCRRFEDARASHERALAIEPASVEALLNLGAALHGLHRFPEALASFDAAITLRSDYADAHRNRGLTLLGLEQPEEAVASYRRALELEPSSGLLRGICRHAQMQICDWSGHEIDLVRLAGAIERGKCVVRPFAALSMFDSPSLQRRVAGIWARENCRPAQRLGPLRRHRWHEKVRVGYFSADFRNHAVSVLAAELFERHDRSRFELTAFAVGPDVRDELRTRVEAAFDRFIPVFDRSDGEVAALARQLEIDIAVDLGGYTQDARPGIFAQRAAPTQIGYLGYLGTMGADFMDYLIADAVIVPAEQRRHYAEKIAYLSSYQVNDSKRPVAARACSRAELGLPPAGFVFCCFNANYKINPEMFASWMRILAAVPGSVLFLLGGSTASERNLRQQADASGLEPARLVFGGKLPYADYLARYRAADLFLDTLPYNAGTTASDALWVGLPVLTCAGEAFAARMGASLLTAVGLPELIGSDLRHYERLAVELATRPGALAAIKCKLEETRSGAPLFDTVRFTGELEALYERMYRRHHLGLLPEHLGTETPQHAAA